MRCKNQMVEKKNHILKSALISRQPIIARQFTSCNSQVIDADHHPHHEKNQQSNPGITSLNRSIIRFAKAGDLISARIMFDQLPNRDVVSWNSIMSAYFQHNRYDEVLQIFSEMQHYHLKPSQTTLSIIISSCANLRALNQGKQIHGFSIKTHSSANVFVGTSMIMLYSKCRMFDCLVQVFDDIDCHNTASWNALISGFVSNNQICDAREVFDRMPSRNVVSWTAMINGYVEIKQIRDAFKLFNAMPMKNSVSWAVMLGGLLCDGQYEEAIGFFNDMMNTGVQASAASVMHIVSACTGLKNLKQGKKIHGYIIKSGFVFDRVIEASLTYMYFKCLSSEEAKLEFDKMENKFIESWNSLICCYIDNNKVDEARKFFDKMNERNEISWNLIINGYLRDNRIDDAIELFSEMPEPTTETCTALMSGFFKNGRLDEARQLFYKMPKRDIMAYTTLILGYMEEGFLEDALSLFEKMPERNVVTYNVIISGLAHHGKVMEAYKLFIESPVWDVISWSSLIIGLVQGGFNYEAYVLSKKMISSDMSPNESVIASLLSASTNLSILTQGELIHGFAIKLGYELCLVVVNSLINMYSKCGDVSTAKLIFDQTDERDLVTWNALIHGYAVNGFGTEGIEIFEKMKRSGIKPDDITFLAILSACAHKFLLEDARYYFNTMRTEYGILPKLTHYACMIDLLCRMGLVEEAEKIVYSMPFKPDCVIWTSLLSGCTINCKVELAEHAAKQLFAVDSRDPMPYLHLIRIYGSTGRWADLQKLRNQMNNLGINKRHGCSWIEIN